MTPNYNRKIAPVIPWQHLSLAKGGNIPSDIHGDEPKPGLRAEAEIRGSGLPRAAQRPGRPRGQEFTGGLVQDVECQKMRRCKSSI